MIYLISSDAFNDSLCTDYCALNLEDIPKLIERYQSEIFSNDVRNIEIKEDDFGSLKAHFEYKAKWEEEDYWEEETYHIRVIPFIDS